MIIEELKNKLGDEMLCAYQTGSALFCTNCKDKDIVVVTNDGNAHSRIFGYSGYDVFTYSKAQLEKIVNFEIRDKYTLYLIALAKSNMLYGTNPFPYLNLFSHKAELVDLMIQQCEEKYTNKKYRNMINRDACLQQTVWLFANYFALVNNSLEFTTEQKEILQKCHDNELPRTYADELYQNLVEMKNNL